MPVIVLSQACGVRVHEFTIQHTCLLPDKDCSLKAYALASILSGPACRCSEFKNWVGVLLQMAITIDMLSIFYKQRCGKGSWMHILLLKTSCCCLLALH